MELHDFQFFTLETLLIQLIILGTILWVLNKFIFKPYLKYLDEEQARREKLENDYKNIEILNKEAEEKRATLFVEARQKAEGIISDSENLARKKSSTIIENAETEAKALVSSAKNEIEKEKQSMMDSVKSKVIDLALKISGKLFDKEIVNKDFVEKELSSIKI